MTCIVKVGDRVAQLILERIYHTSVMEVDDLEATVRGAGGFGSTGVCVCVCVCVCLCGGGCCIVWHSMKHA